MKHNYLNHLLTMLLLLCCSVINAQDYFEVDGIFYRMTYETNKTVGVTYKGETYFHYSNEYTGSVVIPESVVYSGTTYSVSRIGWRAFYGCTGLTSITIPNSVTSIGSEAFYNCTGLESVTIGSGVTSIGDYAFYECTGLASVTIPNSVTSIRDYAFSGCKGLTSIEIPNSVTSIGSYAFNGCKGLTSITIPNSVTSIGSSAFYGCKGLTSITIPNSITSIGGYAFSYCTGLTSITIPNSVTYIDGGAFRNCSGLTSITIPNSVTSIWHDAFYGCTGLTSVTIPNSVTSIGNSAFSYCTGLESVTIGSGVTSIGDDVFYKCSGLTSIEIPNSVTSIGDDVFDGCTGLESIVVENGNSVYDSRNNCNAIIETATNALIAGCKNTVIPNSVTSIGGYAFHRCTGLTSITIPNSVTSIGGYAFEGCTGLTSVTSLIPADALFTVDSSIFYNVDKNNCTLYVPYGAKETYASTAGWKEFANIVEIIPTEVTVTINQYGSATYCSMYDLDFSEVEGLKAYTAIGFNSSTQVVTLARVMTAPAETGIFIKGEPGEYVVPTIEVCNDHTLNLLVGTLEQTTVNSTEGEMSNYKFTVAELDEAPMFYPFEDNTTFSAGKAYLQIPTAWLPATAQKSLSVRFDDGETTDIDELKGESREVKTIYDLQGRVVENPTSGIYIINGKKVVVK